VCQVLIGEVPVTTGKYRPRYMTPGKSGRLICGISNCTEKICMTNLSSLHISYLLGLTVERHDWRHQLVWVGGYWCHAGEERFVPNAPQMFQSDMKHGKTEYSTNIICECTWFIRSSNAIIFQTETFSVLKLSNLRFSMFKIAYILPEHGHSFLHFFLITMT
jgi:hypothetical protein